MLDQNERGNMTILRLIILSTVFLTEAAHAIVSMESVHLGKPQQGYSGAFDINASGEYGNTEKSSVSTGLKLVRNKDAATDFVLMNYQYGQSGNIRDKNKAFIHGRHIQQLTPKYAWEGFAQLSSDEFTRLNLRLLLGAGARISLWQDSKSWQGFFGLGGFYEKEKLDVETGSDEDQTTEAWRGNAYFVFKASINENVSVVSTTYYQPNLGRFGDFRAIEDASLVSKLTETLAAKISLDVTHDSEPPAGVKHTDTTLQVGLDVSF
jgi:putative salt-induced outer membrane protein YdiY